MLKIESPELLSKQTDFFELANSVLDFLWTADTKGKIDYINKRCIDYIGAKNTEDAILHWLDSVHPDDKQETAFKWKKAIEHGSRFEAQCRIKSWYGNYRWFLGRATPVLDKNSKITRWIGNATDIEDQRNLLGELHQSRNQLQVILEGITDGVTVFNKEGEFIFANPVGAHMCGYSNVAEMLSVKTEDIMNRFIILDENGAPFPPENLPGMQAAKGIKNPPESVVQFKMKGSNEIRWVIVSAAPVFDLQGDVLYSVSIFRDFTEHKLQEQALRKNEALLRLIADAGIVLNSSLDYNNTLQKLCELLVPAVADWCIIDLVGEQDSSVTKTWHPDTRKRQKLEDYQKRFHPDWKSISTAMQVIRTGKSEIFESLSDNEIKKNSISDEHYNTVKELEIKSALVVPITGSYGRLGAITLILSETDKRFSSFDLAAAEDIGRRAGMALDKIALYKRERIAREQAEQANRSKSDFLANMSHEIRTPLNSLTGFTELLKNENLSAETRKQYHHIIQRNSEHLLALIDDILDLSKVEAGQMRMEMLNVPVFVLLGEVIESLKQKAKAKSIELDVDINSNVPFQLVTDSVRLKQILTNIIGNAIKFTEKGWVKVFVNLDEDRQKLIFDVMDSGVGINEEAQKKLFQPFMQADTSVTRKFGGTGLGLVLSRKLAQALGGDLYLSSSTEGKGSTFTIEISAKVTSALTHVPDKTRPQRNLKGVRVLVVDDSKDNQFLINQLLKRSEIEVDVADNGEIGNQKAMNGSYDIVLMDVQMPVMDGLSATRKLREKNYKKPVIALTAHAMQDDRKKCLEVGCTDYLTKPVIAEQLLEMICRHVR
jgi:PAS domain S-box-containing protein